MKSPISKAAKIGTVAGLAALAASEASQAAVVLSTFSNVDLTGAYNTPVLIDIDGNGTTDFTITGEVTPNPALFISGSLASVVADDFGVSNMAGYDYGNGATLPNGAYPTTNADLHFPFEGLERGEFYAGVRFTRNNGSGTETHFGWLHFQMPTDGTINGATLIGGGWENDSYTTISIGAVPEPSALVFSFAAGAATLLRRRRK